MNKKLKVEIILDTNLEPYKIENIILNSLNTNIDIEENRRNQMKENISPKK